MMTSSVKKRCGCSCCSNSSSSNAGFFDWRCMWCGSSHRMDEEIVSATSNSSDFRFVMIAMPGVVLRLLFGCLALVGLFAQLATRLLLLSIRLLLLSIGLLCY